MDTEILKTNNLVFYGENKGWIYCEKCYGSGIIESFDDDLDWRVFQCITCQNKYLNNNGNFN